MKNDFLDKNYMIKEAIHTFKENPTGETYGAIIEAISNHIMADRHLLIPVWIPEENDEVSPSYCFHQLHTEDGYDYLVAFTDEEEVNKGPECGILSNFSDVFFDAVFASEHVSGFILNPWSEESFTFPKTTMQLIINEKDMETDPLKGNEILEKAIRFATEKHAGGVRKGTDRAYIGHPLEVMTILQQMDADKNVMMAGLLHDTIEDTEATYMQLKNEFGVDVAALVAAHSEPPEVTWEQGRKQTVEDMDYASFREKLLIMADVTANLRSLWRDYRIIGEKLWERFNAPKDRQAWFYGAVQDKLDMMQNYIETAEIYWEMVGLYKDLFVTFYIDPENDRIYQDCVDGTCFALEKETCEWHPSESPEGLPVVDRKFAERLEDNWRDLM